MVVGVRRAPNRGRDEHQPDDSLGEAEREVDGYPPAHRVADEHHSLDVQRVEHGCEVVDVGERLGLEAGGAEPPPVVGDEAPPVGETIADRFPDPPIADAGMQGHDGGP